jgi:drug/metabolite transporter (DMT)-like permease
MITASRPTIGACPAASTVAPPLPPWPPPGSCGASASRSRKLGLEWLPGGWLAVLRFALAAPLLALAARRGLRAATTPAILAAGGGGYGLVIVLQNLGIERTSVSHAALIVGAVPALVALIAAALGRGAAGRQAWLGFGLALAGVVLVAGSGGGGGAGASGDALVLGSVALSAAFMVAQPALLAGRDAVAVTAVQMAAGATASAPFALALDGLPTAPAATGTVLAVLGLVVAGTLVPFSLFAIGQARVEAEVAGAFVNLEPLVGAVVGAAAFHDPFGAGPQLGAAAIVAGIALSTRPRPRRRPPAARPVACTG